jgi:GDPmannose 4,6-dehydratase
MNSAIENLSRIDPKFKGKVIVTGCTGQDGSYMVEHLLERTLCKVVATHRRVSSPSNIHLKRFENSKSVTFDLLDLNDPESIDRAIKTHQPDYFINFGASAYVPDSWNSPSGTMATNAISVIHILESIRKNRPSCRFYNACSSEIFGKVEESPQSEATRPNPMSIYGVSKNAAKEIVKVYRESYGLHATNGILFNHESPRRGELYVTRKITKALVDRKLGRKKTPLQLGNIESKRDWTDARDMVRGIWMIINQEEPKDYVLASGKTRSIREFIDAAVKEIYPGHSIRSEGEGINEKLYFYRPGVFHNDLGPDIEMSKEFYRPADVQLLLGDASEVYNDLGWKPEISFEQMVADMVETDMDKD